MFLLLKKLKKILFTTQYQQIMYKQGLHNQNFKPNI